MGHPKTADGRDIYAIEKTVSPKQNFFTHDWTDPTTWYQTSIRIADEVATDSGDHLTYNLAHSYVIDLYHGKVFGEDFLKDASNNSYRVAVKVNGTTRLEQDPHYGSGNDFTVNYNDGKIVFLAARDPADVITVTYHYMVNSTFTVKPSAGKFISIDFAEIQFSKDIVMNDTVLFQAYGLVDVFAPQYTPTPYPSGTLIPLGNPTKYKSMQDFYADAVKSYPAYPPLGGSGWRGLNIETTVFDWDYVSATKISSAGGMEIRLSLEHDTPFGGTYGSASFYCLVGDE